MTRLDNLRILPILDTQEIFEEIGKKWAHPGDTRRHSAKGVDDHFVQWVYFCEESMRGYKISDNFKKKNVVSGSSRDIQAYIAFSEALGSEEVEYPGIITSIESAFAQLLSNEGKKILQKYNIHPKKAIVDNTLRGQVKTLIWQMEPITNEAVSTQRDDLHRMF